MERHRSLSGGFLARQAKKRVTFGHKKSCDGMPPEGDLKSCLKFTPRFLSSKYVKLGNEAEKQAQLNALKKPMHVTLYSDTGEMIPSCIQVSDDGSDLLLMERCREDDTRSYLLSDVQYLVMGPRTSNFTGYDWARGSPWLCFSLVSSYNRTIDIECDNVEQFMDLYLGLQHFIPLSHRNFNRARVLWYRAVIKTLLLSIQTGQTISQVWDGLVQDARRDLRSQ